MYKIKPVILKIINQVNIFYDQFTEYFRNFLWSWRALKNKEVYN